MPDINLSDSPDWRTRYWPKLVFCKECKWRNDILAECILSRLSVGPNDYCSKGEAYK